MSEIVLQTVEKNGLKYELVVNELDPKVFANAGFGAVEKMHLHPGVRVSSVDPNNPPADSPARTGI